MRFTIDGVVFKEYCFANFWVSNKNQVPIIRAKTAKEEEDVGTKLVYLVTTSDKSVQLHLGYYLWEKGERYIQIDDSEGHLCFKKLIGRRRLFICHDLSEKLDTVYCAIRKVGISDELDFHPIWQETNEIELSKLLGKDIKIFLTKEMGATELLFRSDAKYARTPGIRHPRVYFDPDNTRLPIRLFILTRIVPIFYQLRSMIH